MKSHDFHQNDPLVSASESSLSEFTFQTGRTDTNIPFPQPIRLTLGDSILNLFPRDFSAKCNSALAKYCEICKASTSHALCFNSSIESRQPGALGGGLLLLKSASLLLHFCNTPTSSPLPAISRGSVQMAAAPFVLVAGGGV